MRLGAAHVIRANSRQIPMADNSVDLCVTSPPYFALRSYTDGGEHYAGQVGDEPTPAEFVDSLIEVTRECVRVLKPSGSLWVNLGDKYATGATPGPQSANTTMTGGAHKGVSNITSRKVVDGVRPKSLIGIPWRYALRCIDDLGLILRAEVIWHKKNGLPESCTDRVRRSHEQWFHMVLNPRYYSAIDEIREAHVGGSTGLAATFARPRPSHDLVPGQGFTQHRAGKPDVPAANPLGKLPGSVWTDDSGESLTRSVLSAVAAGGMTIDEGERILWTATDSCATSSQPTQVAGSGVLTVRTPGMESAAALRPPTEKTSRTESPTSFSLDPSQTDLRSTISAGTGGVSTLSTSNQSPSERTSGERTRNGTGSTAGIPSGTPTTSRPDTGNARRAAGSVTSPASDVGESVWHVATEPLKVPPELGVDHFAAFATEFPKRIIAGWSPAGVCVECGEGRRPVTTSLREVNREKIVKRADAYGGVISGGVNRSTLGDSRGVPSATITGYACACPDPTAPTTPAVVLDCFGGTGTTAMVAKALGRTGVTVDMSADYCRLAQWRTNDRNQLAKVVGVEKVEPVHVDQLDLFGEIA